MVLVLPQDTTKGEVRKVTKAIFIYEPERTKLVREPTSFTEGSVETKSIMRGVHVLLIDSEPRGPSLQGMYQWAARI